MQKTIGMLCVSEWFSDELIYYCYCFYCGGGCGGGDDDDGCLISVFFKDYFLST